jgi:hypothetical protein
VLGGCEDAEFSEHSRRLMERFVRGDLILVVSTLTVQELAAAPGEVRRHLASVPENYVETLQLDAEARELAEGYIAEGVISAKMRADAQHIAIATVARVDVLVSWNFKHIVNLYRIHGYNSVNLRRGYPTPISPTRKCLMNEARSRTLDGVARLHANLAATTKDLYCVRGHIDDLNQDTCAW